MTVSIGFQSLGRISEPEEGTVAMVIPGFSGFSLGYCESTWTGAAGVMVMGTQRSTKGQGPNNPFTGHLQRPDSLAPDHALRLPTSPPKHHSLLSKPFTPRGHLRSNP